jgi:hypothetical protein
MTVYSDYVRRLLDETREEVARADTKASIVLAGAGVVFGILLTGFVTGNVSLAGERWYVGMLVWLAGLTLVGGVVLVGLAVYPRTSGAERGHGRWFAEIEQFGKDESALAAAVEGDAHDGGRDLHQARVLAGIVGRKYRLTKAGMWSLSIGLATAGLAGLLSVWTGEP